MSYSNLVSKKIQAYSGNYTSGRTSKITEICIHHTAGVMSIEQLGNLWQTKGRNGSSNYGIGNDGRIGCYVDENDTAWCNSNWNSNCRSVSIETSNDSTGGDWHVGDKALNSLIKLVADIAKRNGMGKLVKGKNLTWHKMYTATACPGPYLLSKIDYIIEQANKINGQSNAADQIITAGSKVRFNGVFKINEVIKPNSKYKNGAIGCYATCYGSPCDANDYIPCGPLATCNANGGNANYNGVLKQGGYWTCNATFTVKKVELPTSKTANGVAILEADGIQFRVDCGPLYEVSNS
jgi:hypothetical protein